MNILKKILYRSPEFLFGFLSRNDMPNLAALFFYLTLRQVKGVKQPTVQSPYKILMLPRAVFTEDVIASLGSSGEFRIFSPLETTIKGLAQGILPPHLDSNFYVTDTPEVEDRKRKYRDFLKLMWTKLHRYIRFDAVVTANFGYYSERELATVLEDLGVPFIAMHKENLKSAGRIEFARIIYRERRGPFTGRRILVYNENERRLQIESGIATPEKITVCGMPRLDRLHQWRWANGGRAGPSGQRPQVLFFSFNPKTILPRIGRRVGAGLKGNVESLDRRMEAMSWDRLANLTHQAICQLAEETPGVDVVVKSKVHQREWAEMYRMLTRSHALPANLRIVVGGDPMELISRSDVVCGFNTTALIEAVAAGKPVVVPRYEEALDDRLRPYIVDLEDAVCYADSPEQLVVRLRDQAHSRRESPVELDAASVRVLDRWVGNADGRAGERVRNAVLAEVAGPIQEGPSGIHG